LLQAYVLIAGPNVIANKKYLIVVFGADFRSLAALRVGCGLLILFDLIQSSTDLFAH